MTPDEADLILGAISVLRVSLPVLAIAVPASAPFDDAADVFLREAFEAVVRLEKPGQGTLAAELAAKVKNREDVLAAWRVGMAAKAALPPDALRALLRGPTP